MSVDKTLQSYARAHLLRADPNANHLMIENFVQSEDFKKFVGIFDKQLAQRLANYKATLKPAATTPVPPVPPAPEPLPDMEASMPPGESESESDDTLPINLAKDNMPTTPNPDDHPETTGDNLPPQSLVPPTALPLEATQASEPPLMLPEPAPKETSPLPSSTGTDTPAPTAANTAASGADQPVPEKPPEPELADITFRLRNARIGEAYAQQIEPQAALGQAVVYYEITIPNGLDLVANKNTGMITGTPAAAGEHDIVVIYHFASQSPSRKRRAVIKLVVNPDPKTMWKNLPSNRDDVYWKADQDCAGLTGAEFRIVAASKRGRSHAHVGSFRDDHYRIHHLPDAKWYIAVVSDGAGSAKFSRRGSEIICDESMKHLLRTLNGAEGSATDQAAEAYTTARARQLDPAQIEAARKTLHNKLFVTVGHAAYYAVKAITEECANRPELKATYKDYSSTALIVACKRYPFGTLCVAYWVGDGAVAIYSKDNGITLLGDVDSGEYSGQTRFLESGEVTQEALLKRTRFEIVDDMTALVLMTDGVSDPKFETEAQLARASAWDALWQELEQSVGLSGDGEEKEQKLLAWLDFWSPGNHDDRTIAVIC